MSVKRQQEAPVNTGAISFIVLGHPLPKGSKTGIVVNGRAVLIEGVIGGKDEKTRKRNRVRTQNIKDWEKLIARSCAAIIAPLRGMPWNFPVNVRARFWFECPKSRVPGSYHDVPPDADKCFRLVGDALKKGGIIFDDSRIVSWDGSEKRYCWPGESPRVEITISPARLPDE